MNKKIYDKQKQIAKNLDPDYFKITNKLTHKSYLCAVLPFALVFAFHYLNFETSVAVNAGLVIFALLISYLGFLKCISAFETEAKVHDRKYFLECIRQSESESELEQMGFLLCNYDNLVYISTEEFFDKLQGFLSIDDNWLSTLNRINEKHNLSSVLENYIEQE